MNDQEALAQINWAMDEYLKGDGNHSSTILAMGRIAQTIGRNAQWHKVTAA